MLEKLLELLGMRPEKPLTDWQRVFSQSKVNGASYRGETLPARPVQWPKDTFLQRKLRPDE